MDGARSGGDCEKTLTVVTVRLWGVSPITTTADSTRVVDARIVSGPPSTEILTINFPLNEENYQRSGYSENYSDSSLTPGKQRAAAGARWRRRVQQRGVLINPYQQ